MLAGILTFQPAAVSAQTIRLLNDTSSETSLGLLPQSFGLPSNDSAIVIARVRSARSNLASAPVRMIFSAHGNQTDGSWAVRRARLMLKGINPETPLTIWIENAYPAALPQTVSGIQSLLGQNAPSGKNWCEEFLADTLSVESRALLEKIFRQAVAHENPRQAFENTQNPFYKALREGIRDLELRGRNIRLEFEEPSFEAYLDDLRRDVMSLLVLHWTIRHRDQEALASLGLAYRYISKSLETRDENLGVQILSDARLNPGAVHLVFRGLAHEKTMTHYFEKAKMPFRLIHQSPISGRKAYRDTPRDIHAYLAKYRQLPSLETLHGILFLSRHLDSTRQSLSQ